MSHIHVQAVRIPGVLRWVAVRALVLMAVASMTACGAGRAEQRTVRPVSQVTPRAAYPAFPVAPEKSVSAPRPAPRTDVARAAAQLLNPGQKSTPRSAGDGGMALVRASYARAGSALPPSLRSPRDLHAHARATGALYRGRAPAPGDVAFFHDTHDANADGRANDPLTMVALVERVEADGTVVLIGQVRQGVLRFRMNTAHPHQRRDAAGRVLNHYLSQGAPARGARAARIPRTSAQLLAGFAHVPVTPGKARGAPVAFAEQVQSGEAGPAM